MERVDVAHSDVGRGGAAQRTASRSGISTGDVARREAGSHEARTLDGGGPRTGPGTRHDEPRALVERV